MTTIDTSQFFFVFIVNGLYTRWWRYVSTRDMWGAVRGVTVATLLADLILYAFPPAQERLSRGIAALDYLLHAIGAGRHLALGRGDGPLNHGFAPRPLAAPRALEVDIDED